MPNAQAAPATVISTPATAGPTVRASWKLPEFSETALRTSRCGTISLTNVCRVGLSTTVTRPRQNATR